jgi:cytochrome P450
MLGVDSICAALTFAIWDLARLPECRKKAAEEVVKFFPSREDMTPEALKALPFLNAFLMESMRFHSVSGDKWERMSPDEGAAVGGYQIPKGVFTLARQSLLNPGAGYL